MSSSQNQNKASSSHSLDHSIWKFICKLTCPNKIKTLLWICCRNALPTAMALYKRNSKESGGSSICAQGSETIDHILLTCDWTRGVQISLCGLIIDMQGISTFDKQLYQIMRMLEDSQDVERQMLTKIAFLCGTLSKVRCELVIPEERLQPLQVVHRLQKAIVESQLDNFIADKRQVLKNDQQDDHGSIKPELGWLKFNTYGSFCNDTNKSVIGGVVRNHNGKVIEAIGKKVEGSSALCLEALELRDAVQLAVKSRVQNAFFEIDSSLNSQCEHSLVRRP